MKALLKRIWNTKNLTLNTTSKWKDMQNSSILINLDDKRSIANILMLSEMPDAPRLEIEGENNGIGIPKPK